VIEGIRFSELLEYTRQETARWKDWFRSHPDALDIPCDIAGGKTVRDLLFHIFVVELHFAHRILSLPKPDHNLLPRATLDELFGVSEEAAGKTEQFLSRGTPQEWTEQISLGFRDAKASFVAKCWRTRFSMEFTTADNLR